MDQPIGTGYSTASGDSAYPTTEDEIATDLYFFLQKWYSIDQYQQYAKVPLYLTGESYAGHYIPAFGYKILMENSQLNSTTNLFINLQGVAIGDGLTDPCSQVEAGPRAAFDFGLISPKVFAKAKQTAMQASQACLQQDWSLAHQLREEMENIVLSESFINKYNIYIVINLFNKVYYLPRLLIFLRYVGMM